MWCGRQRVHVEFIDVVEQFDEPARAVIEQLFALLRGGYCRVAAGDKLTFELRNTYAQLNAFDWSN